MRRGSDVIILKTRTRSGNKFGISLMFYLKCDDLLYAMCVYIKDTAFADY